MFKRFWQVVYKRNTKVYYLRLAYTIYKLISGARKEWIRGSEQKSFQYYSQARL